ncbi:MAG TPA: HAMP domain-containing sensor histidine kinase [Stellaceae bacterium]|nr:HAMP domain-containing sensor histidine kinase [Stellaceae bacterium]
MTPVRLLRTNAFRIAALYLALFAASMLALLAFIYVSTADYIERQTEETVDQEISALRDEFQRGELPLLRHAIAQRSVGPLRSDQTLYLLTDPNLVPIEGNLSKWPNAQSVRPGWISFPLDVEVKGVMEVHQARAAVIDLSVAGRLGHYHLLVGRDLRDANLFRSSMLQTLAWASVLTLALGVVGGLFLTRNMLRRVDAVNRTSERIMRGDFSQRVPLSGSRDEFDQLATNLNAMLDQIERLMSGMRQVTDNIAHDLRTPLSRLRARLELALLEKPDAARYGEALRQSIAEADTLLGTFNALLSIAEAEAGTRREMLGVIDLEETARSVAELYEPVADEKGLALIAALDPRVRVRGDRHLLSQAIANLLDNALKYTPEGSVTLTVRAAEGWAYVEVTDTGPGVPAEQREAVFDRFYRLEGSRSTPGNGLGLSLVRAVARMHGGSVRMEDGRPGTARPGLKVTLAIPAIETAERPAQVPHPAPLGTS